MTTELLRLLAYCPGPWSAAAREALQGASALCSMATVDLLHESDWLSGLLPLYLAAAPGVACPGISDAGHCEPRCSPSGKVPDPHALLRLAAGCARACLSWCRDGNCGKVILCAHCCKARDALDAYDAYLAVPSEERRKACQIPSPSGLPKWLWAISREICYGAAAGGIPDCYAPDAIQAALTLTNRAAISRCAVELVSEECGRCRHGTRYAGYENGPEFKKCEACQGTGRVPK